MSKKDDGGGAFPSPGVVLNFDRNEHQQGAYEGMSLRDYFAAKALQGMLAALDAAGLNYSNPAMMAEHAFVFANAMLAERAK